MIGENIDQESEPNQIYQDSWNSKQISNSSLFIIFYINQFKGFVN